MLYTVLFTETNHGNTKLMLVYCTNNKVILQLILQCGRPSY